MLQIFQNHKIRSRATSSKISTFNPIHFSNYPLIVQIPDLMKNKSFKTPNLRSSIIFALLFSVGIHCLSGQNIEGNWYGALEIQGIKLRLVFHINSSDTGLTAVMDSPDQGAFGIPATKVEFEKPDVVLEVSNIGIVYSGTLEQDVISGVFKQGPLEMPLILSKTEPNREITTRPQEPKEPLPYVVEDIFFDNPKDQIKLAGTLTLPESQDEFPMVILISGSGPQNRNEELMGHKPFLVLADYLTRNGIGVLRFDDRGVGQSEGDFGQATSADFAQDVSSAVSYIRSRTDIKTTKIGLIGHSEGGLIAPMVAAEDSTLDFIVLMAGPGVSGGEILRLQTEDIAKANGMNEAQIAKELKLLNIFLEELSQEQDLEAIKLDLASELEKAFTADSNLLSEGVTLQSYTESALKQVTPWMHYFLMHNPKPYLEAVTCTVLAINGSKDLQVAPGINLKAIKEALDSGGNKAVTLSELPGLNHLFQESTTGSPSEYAQIEQTFSPVALKVISDWILLQVTRD
ncbi:MAG: hypothetical protein RLZZ241_304 [Bacteroidota bacterium]|jgi:pimeloyl-ACP methyl ester carboxylesterase